MRALVAAFALVAASAASVSAQGRSACEPRGQVVQRLADKYGETLRSMGMHQNDGVVEIYASDATGTWTILMSRPDGMTCLLAAGEMWEQNVPPTELKAGDPT